MQLMLFSDSVNFIHCFYFRLLHTTGYIVDPASDMKYCTAGNFHEVQNFAFVEGRQKTRKLKLG